MGLGSSLKFYLFILTLMNVHSVHSGDVYNVSKSTIKASGGTVSAGGLEIKGSVGQSAASFYASGGAYSVNGGIWTNGSLSNDIIFKNGLEN